MSDNRGVSATLKAPNDQSGPWLVFHASDPTDLDDMLSVAFPSVSAESLAERVHKSYVEYAAVSNAVNMEAPGVTSARVPGAAPAAAPAASFSLQSPGPAPAWAGQQAGPPAPSCAHGVRTLKEGTSKAGKPYKGWMCPAQQNDPTKCPAQWVS